MTTKDPSEQRIWRLASLRISPESQEPELYCLVLEADKDQPLTHAGRILFFRSAADAGGVLEEYARDFEADETDIDEPFFVCDIAGALYALAQRDIDEDAASLGAINTLLDLVGATPLSIPPATKQVMGDAADHFTFEKSVATLFSGDDDKRSDLVNAILWCVGAVCVMAEILPSEADKP
jgi:hypothetical protein